MVVGSVLCVDPTKAFEAPSVRSFLELAPSATKRPVVGGVVSSGWSETLPVEDTVLAPGGEIAVVEKAEEEVKEEEKKKEDVCRASTRRPSEALSK